MTNYMKNNLAFDPLPETGLQASRLSRWTRLTLLLLLFCWTLPAGLYAKDDDKKEEEPPPEPEEVDLTTRDGLHLYSTYYPGTKGKKSVPVVILHDIKESGDDYESLALYLQKKGHAVLVPDMRGHGRSTQIDLGRNRTATIKGSRLNDKQMKAIVRNDMGAIRSFLLDENNQGNLNVEKLCLVGTGAGALVAMNYAAVDWSWQDLANKKQGKDVKALVLISPAWAHKKLQARTFIDDRRVQGKLSIMMLVGREDKATYKSSKSIHKLLSRYHPEPDTDVRKLKSLYLFEKDTELQGEKLINTPEFKANRTIAGFIKARLGSKNIPWQDRTDP